MINANYLISKCISIDILYSIDIFEKIFEVEFQYLKE